MRSIRAANYERAVTQDRKFGLSSVLTTQDLTGLRALADGLADDILGNQSALVAFRVDAATDAEELAPRLDGQFSEVDIGNLPRQWCYLKLSERGLRIPAFSVAVAATPARDPALAEALRAQSRRRHARPVAEVDGIIAGQWAWFTRLTDGGLHGAGRRRRRVADGGDGGERGAAGRPGADGLAAVDHARERDGGTGAAGVAPALPASAVAAGGAPVPATVAEAMAAAHHRRRRRGGRTPRPEPSGDQLTMPEPDTPADASRGGGGG